MKVSLEKVEHDVAQQKQLLRMAMEAQEQERKQVAKKLHDEVGALVQALRNATLTVSKDVPEEDKKDMTEIVQELTSTLTQISWDLMPSSMERFGLSVTLQEFCKRQTERTGIQVTFQEVGEPRILDNQQNVLLYRIVQEVISLTIKHTDISKITIRIKWNTPIVLEVEDNGSSDSGLLDSHLHESPALHTIVTRVNLLQGSLSFEKINPMGSKVLIKIP